MHLECAISWHLLTISVRHVLGVIAMMACKPLIERPRQNSEGCTQEHRA